MSTSTVCAACGEEIYDGNVLIAFGMSWHPYHLVCATCRKDFSDGALVKEGEDGYAYCERCYEEKFSKRCCVCNEFINEGDIIEALGKYYHGKCFKCPKCTEPFKDNSFFPGDDGNPYCEKHYYESKGMLCYQCGMPILQGKRVRMGEKAFHAEHFCCEICKKNLAGSTYKEADGKPYCPMCHMRKYG